MSKILNYGSVNIDEFFTVPHICKSGETMSSTGYVVRAGGKGTVFSEMTHVYTKTDNNGTLGANQSIAFAKVGLHIGCE